MLVSRQAVHRITIAVIALGLLWVPGVASGQAAPSAHLRQVRFIPDGRYALGQDDLDIAVLTVQPFVVLFRIPAGNSTLAQFTPDSKDIVFLSSVTRVTSVQLAYTKSAARVERWRVADQAFVDSTEIPKLACGTEELSPDGRVLACDDFEGTLRLIDVTSGQTIFEKKRFVELVRFYHMNPDGTEDLPNGEVAGDLGAAYMAFSPDGRFFVALPSNGEGNIQAWDLREKTAVKVPGYSISTLSWTFHFAFVASDQFIETSGLRYKHNLAKAKLVKFPSGQVLLKPRIPWGNIFSAADPSFVLVRPFGESARDTPNARSAAVEFATGQVIISDTPALDVLGRYYVAEPQAGEIGLYERGKGLQAAVMIAKTPPAH